MEQFYLWNSYGTYTVQKNISSYGDPPFAVVRRKWCAFGLVKKLYDVHHIGFQSG